MHVGKVTKLCHEKEYGSIRTKSGQDVHFHKYCLWNCKFHDLYESQEVEFEMAATHKGFLGFEIRPFQHKVLGI